MNQKNKDNNGTKIEYFVVAYVDLLGQQDVLRNIRVLPKKNSSQDDEEIKKTIAESYGAVKNVREMFVDSFEEFTRPSGHIDLSFLPDGKKKEFAALISNDIQCQFFSDTVVVFMSLSNDVNKLPVRGIYGIFGAAAVAFILSLSEGRPIRVGIDIGIGWNIEENEIYGPALSRAYLLESHVADYPRIVVGEELERYLKYIIHGDHENSYDQISKAPGRRCYECLDMDEDGHMIVDYLGDTYANVFAKKDHYPFIEKAYNNVLLSLERFKKEKDSKLAFRYALLKRYFDNRMHLWKEWD